MRSLILPDPSNTLHLMGDLHFGYITQARIDKTLADLLSGKVPTPKARAQVGDNVQDGSAAGQDTTAFAMYAQLTDAPLRVVPGNHDLATGFGSPNARTLAQWITAFATYLEGGTYPYVYNAGFVKLIAVGTFDPAAVLAYQPYLPQSHLDFLDAQLAATTSDCWIISHAPLRNTVLGSTVGINPQWSSAETNFFTHGPASDSADDSAIRTILGNRTNAKAWFSGHTHSAIQAPGFFTTITVGGRSFACVNCSALVYIGRSIEWNDPLRSIYATKVTGGIELRVRNHGSQSWDSVGGSRVTTLVVG